MLKNDSYSFVSKELPLDSVMSEPNQPDDERGVQEESLVLRPKVKKNFIGDVARLSSGTALAQGLAIVVLPLITRLYSPEALGLSLVFISLITILGAVACLRYEQAIVLPAADEEAVNLLAASLLIALIVSIVLTVLLSLFYQPLLRLLNAEGLLPFLWLFGPAIFVGAALHSLNFWNSRTRQFGRLSMSRVVSALVLVGVQVGAGLAGFNGAGSLIIAHFLGLLTTTLVLGIQIVAHEGRLLRQSIQFQGIFRGVRKYRKFPIYGTWSELLNLTANQLPTFLLSAFFSTAVAGYYGLAARMLRMPITLLGNAIAQVFYQRASVAYVQGKLAALVGSVFHTLTVIGIFPLFLLTLIGEDLFTTLFGVTWIEAGRYTQILSPLSLLMFVGISLVLLPNILGRQEGGLVFYGALFVVQLFALWSGGVMGNATLALFFLSVSSAVVWLLYFVWIFRHVGLSGRLVLVPLLPATLLSGVLLGLLFVAMVMLQLTGWLLLICSILTCLIYYLALIGLDSQMKEYSRPYLCQVRRYVGL